MIKQLDTFLNLLKETTSDIQRIADSLEAIAKELRVLRDIQHLSQLSSINFYSDPELTETIKNIRRSVINKYFPNITTPIQTNTLSAEDEVYLAHLLTYLEENDKELLIKIAKDNNLKLQPTYIKSNLITTYPTTKPSTRKLNQMLNQKQNIFINQVKAAINSFELNNATEIAITKAFIRNKPVQELTTKEETLTNLEASSRTLRFIVSAMHLLIDSTPVHRLFTDPNNTNRLYTAPDDPFIAAATFFQYAYALIIQRSFNDNQIHSFKWIYELLSTEDLQHIPDYDEITKPFTIKSIKPTTEN